MATHRVHSASSVKAEVTIASPPGEAPRLDFSHFSAFGMGDDEPKTVLPRSKSSSHIAHSIRTTTTHLEDHDEKDFLDDASTRARSECERGGMGDLIDFLREPPPADYIQMPSTFDFDLGQLDDDEEPGKWKQLANKLKKMNPIKPASPTGTVHIQLKFPEPAVAAKTAEGHRHMAISVPMEHCALGPDSKWAVPAYNATKPLPPSPHRGPRKGSVASRTRSHLSDSITSVDEDVLNMVPAKAVPRMEYGRSSASIRLWQNSSTPLSPPQSPPSTIASESRSPGTPSQASRVELPMDPSAYIELTMPPPPSEPMTPESLMEDRVRNITHKIKNTTLILQSAPGPPPSSAPRPVPYSSFHPMRPGSSPAKPQPTKPLPRRPDLKVLPARRSSLKNVTLSAAHKHRTRPSLDEVLNGDQLQRTEIQSAETDSVIEKPEPSPKSISCRSLSSSILSAESEPVVASARAVRGYSSNSIVLQTTPGTTPRASLIMLSSSEKQTSSFSPGAPGETDGSPYKFQRKASTRTNCSRRSRAERVRSLKQRDMEVARAQMQQRQFESGMQAAADASGRPATADTVISSLRLPSREGEAGKASLSSFADSFPRPPTADSTGRNERQYGMFQGPSREEVEAPNDANRESYCSSTAPRRYNSYLRTSWASSIPLLDRISSYAPSERSFMQILDSAAPMDTQPHRRSDSATLPRIEQERLTPSRLSRVTSIASNMDGSESKGVSRRASTSSLTVTPGILSEKRSFNRLDRDATPRPTTPKEERWSATTMQSPGAARTGSPPPALSTNSRNERMSPELTPPVSRRGSPEHCTSCGQETVPERSSMTPFGLEEDARRADLHQVGHIHHGIWSPASLQNINSHVSDNAQRDYYHSSVQRDSQQLPRMSSAELHAHYDSLHATDRASDVAHHILLNQERMEFELRRQEQNQKLSFARLMHNQMLFFSELERQLEGMGRSVSGRRKPRASLGWDGMTETKQGATQPKHAAKSSDTASMAFELEAMDPLMHDLRDGSRVSHESPRFQTRSGVAFGPQPKTMPAAVGGHELDTYFNMI